MPDKPSIDWQPISTAPHSEFLLLAVPSGYTTTDWDVCVGRFTRGYHDRWDTVGNDAIEPEPVYWSPLPDFPKITPAQKEETNGP